MEKNMNYKDIYDHITGTHAFGVSTMKLSDGSVVGISAGIGYLIKHESDSIEQIEQALERFYSADFGDMFETEYERSFIMPKTWEDRNAYGEYEIDTVDEPIRIHYEPTGMKYDVVIYFQFER